MRWEEILSAFKSLSRGQGLYGRILRAIQDMEYKELEEFKDYMEAQGFKDTLELVMFIEEGGS